MSGTLSGEAILAKKNELASGLSLSDLHLIGKIVLSQDDEAMREDGFSEKEVEHSNVLMEKLDAALTAIFGKDWPDRQPL